MKQIIINDNASCNPHGLIAISIIIIIIIASAFLIPFSPLSVFDDGEYHTGFSMSDVHNCDTISKKVGCWDFGGTWGCWYGNIEKDYVELIRSPMNNAPIVTSMKTGEGSRSVEVTVFGVLTYLGIPTTYWTPDVGWYQIDIKYSKFDPWHNIINTKDNRIDQDIVSLLTGSRTKQKYYTKSIGAILPGLPPPFISKTLKPITFAIKDPQVGIMRVRQMAEFTALFGALRETKVCSIDYAFLVSGKGTVEKVDPQDRYIAGEDTVRFRCDTGFSGYTQGGAYINRGWELKIYNNKGNLIHKWIIDDDKKGTRYDKNGNKLDYPIPIDAVEPGISHTWQAVLTNTLFDQDYEIFFAITREELEQAPDIKPIEFGDDEYNLGDTVVIYLEGIPNPDGRNRIDGFLVNIQYGRSGWIIDTVEDYYLKYVKATQNKATISFKASKGDTYVNVEAWAFDEAEDEGGIMSEGETAQIWIKDKEADPTIDEIHWLAFIIPIIAFIVFLVIAIFIPGGIHIKLIVIIAGVIIAVVLFFYLRANIDDILTSFSGIISGWFLLFYYKIKGGRNDKF
jgi:hypothetical protein